MWIVLGKIISLLSWQGYDLHQKLVSSAHSVSSSKPGISLAKWEQRCLAGAASANKPASTPEMWDNCVLLPARGSRAPHRPWRGMRTSHSCLGKGKYVQGQTTQPRQRDGPLIPGREASEAGAEPVCVACARAERVVGLSAGVRGEMLCVCSAAAGGQRHACAPASPGNMHEWPGTSKAPWGPTAASAQGTGTASVPSLHGEQTWGELCEHRVRAVERQTRAACAHKTNRCAWRHGASGGVCVSGCVWRGHAEKGLHVQEAVSGCLCVCRELRALTPAVSPRWRLPGAGPLTHCGCSGRARRGGRPVTGAVARPAGGWLTAIPAQALEGPGRSGAGGGRRRRSGANRPALPRLLPIHSVT